MSLTTRRPIHINKSTCTQRERSGRAANTIAAARGKIEYKSSICIQNTSKKFGFETLRFSVCSGSRGLLAMRLILQQRFNTKKQTIQSTTCPHHFPGIKSASASSAYPFPPRGVNHLFTSGINQPPLLIARQTTHKPPKGTSKTQNLDSPTGTYLGIYTI